MSEKIAVHCPTKQEFHYAQTKMLNERGSWCNGDKKYHDEYWDRHKEETCLEVTEGMYCFKQWYQGNGYKIIPASEYLGETSSSGLRYSTYIMDEATPMTSMLYEYYKLTTSGEQNKPKGNIMSNIINFAKDLVLSADEKLLRKHGLKDECGNYTEAYNELRRMSANKEFEPKAVEIAKQKEAEETK